MGFIGPNGTGKSTLMKIIMEEIQPDAGYVEIGQTVKIAYYAQEIGDDVMNPRQRVIDYIRDVAEYVNTDEGRISAARMLERFLFAGEDQYGLIGKLSGGERRRLHLCRVLMEAPNVLILDEPTNDLDIATLRILEDYLDTFQGIVIVVSHDRYFLDRTVRRIFAFEGNGVVKQYEGGYTDYWNKLECEKAETSLKGGASEPKEEKKSKKEYKNRQKKLKFTYAEQREFETIDEDIAKLEEKIEQAEKQMSEHAKDFVKLQELMQEKEDLQSQLDEKMDRWVYLNDLAEQIEAAKQ